MNVINAPGVVLSNGWTVSIELVTPSIAAQWLSDEINVGNRRLRPGLVKKYDLTMSSGHWLLAPEPLVFSIAGRLMNAQHRLRAIVSSGRAQQLMIVRGVDPSVYRVLDRGASRSAADALGIDKKLAEVARLAAHLVQTYSAALRTCTDPQISTMADLFGESHVALMEECSTATKFFSSAPIRLAACIADVVENNRGHAFPIYRNMVLGHISELPPIAQGFMGAVLRGGVHSGGGQRTQFENLVRASAVFDPSRASNAKTQIRRLQSSLARLAQKIRPADWTS